MEELLILREQPPAQIRPTTAELISDVLRGVLVANSVVAVVGRTLVGRRKERLLAPCSHQTEEQASPDEADGACR